MVTLREQYERRGHTDALAVCGPDALRPLQELVYLGTAAYLVEHDARLPLVERISLPFRTVPPAATWVRLLTMVQDSLELAALCESVEVREAFERLFGTAVVPFGASRFRARCPGERRTEGWHQDEATWYAGGPRELAHRGPATLWLSVNGADVADSVEIMPESHRGHLEYHRLTPEREATRALLPKTFRASPPFVVEAEPGEGVFFHPLAFHRAVPMHGDRPRYAVEVRYYPAGAPRFRYPVRFGLRARRLLAR